jgi:hypothetical protein
MNKPAEVTDKEKFELEFMATDELCFVAQKHKADIDELSSKIRNYGTSHPDYSKWADEKRLKMRRRYHILGCIKRRQLQLL